MRNIFLLKSLRLKRHSSHKLTIKELIEHVQKQPFLGFIRKANPCQSSLSHESVMLKVRPCTLFFCFISLIGFSKSGWEGWRRQHCPRGSFIKEIAVALRNVEGSDYQAISGIYGGCEDKDGSDEGEIGFGEKSIPHSCGEGDYYPDAYQFVDAGNIRHFTGIAFACFNGEDVRIMKIGKTGQHKDSPIYRQGECETGSYFCGLSVKTKERVGIPSRDFIDIKFDCCAF